MYGGFFFYSLTCVVILRWIFVYLFIMEKMKKLVDNDHETKVRLRRTKSVTRAEEIQRADYMVRRSQPDKP